MEAIYVVVLVIVLIFSWKLFTILRNPEISKPSKRMAINIFVVSIILFAIALYFEK